MSHQNLIAAGRLDPLLEATSAMNREKYIAVNH